MCRIKKDRSEVSEDARSGVSVDSKLSEETDAHRIAAIAETPTLFERCPFSSPKRASGKNYSTSDVGLIIRSKLGVLHYLTASRPTDPEEHLAVEGVAPSAPSDLKASG